MQLVLNYRTAHPQSGCQLHVFDLDYEEGEVEHINCGIGPNS